MRMLSGEEAPDAGERVEGHNVVMQYFAQDEATRMDPAPTVYETLASGSPNHMVPAIRNILGGFLFSGDDVYKRVRVLSGGERTRLAVARMLLRPSNTLLLDEPTNHLDLDSKEVLLDALDRLRRHADLRVARSVFRRAAGDQDHRGRQGRDGHRLPGHLRGVPVAQGAGVKRQRRRARWVSVSRRAQARRFRRAPPRSRRAGAPGADRRRSKTRIAGSRTCDPRDRADDVGARFLRGSRRRAARHRPPPGADVGSRAI